MISCTKLSTKPTYFYLCQLLEFYIFKSYYTGIQTHKQHKFIFTLRIFISLYIQ